MHEFIVAYPNLTAPVGFHNAYAYNEYMHDYGGVAKPSYWHWFGIIGAIVGVAVVLLPAMVSAVAVEPMKPVVSAPTASVPGDLASIISEFASSQSVEFSVYVVDLKTGETASNLPDKEFVAASMYKLYVAEGVLSKGTKLSDGQEICLRAMITVSDNECGRTLGATLGWEDYNDDLINLGYTGTKLNQSNITTTARDVAKFYQKLYAGNMLASANNQKLTDLLKDQRVTNRLPKGLPTGTEIAHKTGDLSGYMHDSGIVYGTKTDYIVVALSGPWGKAAQSFPAFQQLSSQLYDYFNR